MEKKDKMTKPAPKPKKEKKQKVKLDMSFEDAIDLALKTPIRKKKQ